jgi:hypothetical protein
LRTTIGFDLANVVRRVKPRLAAEYLDSRQKEWFAWPAAKAPGGTCFSCHTNMTYLLARPALRKLLEEAQPTACETALLDGLRARGGKRSGKDLSAGFAEESEASQAVGVESVLAAFFLLRSDPPGALTPPPLQALDRMWSFQNQTAEARGSWPWFELELDPWETAESPFCGAALAALAVEATPSRVSQPAERRQELLGSSRIPPTADGPAPAQSLDAALGLKTLLPISGPPLPAANWSRKFFMRKREDGSWTLDSLGPWKARPAAPAK